MLLARPCCALNRARRLPSRLGSMCVGSTLSQSTFIARLNAPAHAFYKCDNGWYVSDSDSLLEAFRQASSSDLEDRKNRSLLFAKSHLDYNNLSQRYVSQGK